VRISRTWTPDLRAEYRGILSWTFLRNSDPVEDKELLDQAVEEGWTVSTFLEHKYPDGSIPLNIMGRIKSLVYKLLNANIGSDIKQELMEIQARLDNLDL